MTMTRLFASAVPTIVGRASSVVASALISPISGATPTSSLIAVNSGATGASISITMVTTAVSVPTLPEGSMGRALKECEPFANCLLGVKVQLPNTSTVAEPITFAASNISIVSPGVAPDPEIVGVSSSVVSPWATLPCTVPTSSDTISGPISDRFS